MIVTQQRTICPRCGTVVPLRPDPLTETSIDIWEAAGRLFWMGRRMTIRELAQRSGKSPGTVHDHLQRLMQAGLVERVPLPRRNGSRQRYAYQGRLLRSHN